MYFCCNKISLGLKSVVGERQIGDAVNFRACSVVQGARYTMTSSKLQRPVGQDSWSFAAPSGQIAADQGNHPLISPRFEITVPSKLPLSLFVCPSFRAPLSSSPAPTVIHARVSVLCHLLRGQSTPEIPSGAPSIRRIGNRDSI